MVHGTTSKACPYHCPTLRNIMVLVTMRTNYLSWSILILPLSMLVLPLSLVLMASVGYSAGEFESFLNSKDLAVEILKFVCPSHSLLKGNWWHNACGVTLTIGLSPSRNFAIFFSIVLIKSGEYRDNLSNFVRYSRLVMLPCTSCWN